MLGLDKYSILGPVKDNARNSIISGKESEIIEIVSYFKENIDQYLKYSGIKEVNNLRVEFGFIHLVISFINKIMLEKHYDQTILLFDIDETICVRNYDGEDIYRPSFFYILEVLKDRYGYQIDFGVLSSRGLLHEAIKNDKSLGKISGYINHNFLVSSREESYELDIGNERYQSNKILFPEAYNEKINALSKVKEMHNESGINFVLIDDIIEGGKLEEFGEGISVRKSLFLG